ncbi:MAG TPA: anti-sigma B factor RsbW [Pseudogracilibacillus sp.]|nr:anti-sigma B factor RsbW [Pseudogracilibacillus sp.]
MEKFDFIELKVPAKAEYVGVLRLSLSGIASRMGFSYEAIEDLKVALSEAATNVVSHAYEKKEKGELTLGFGVYDDRLEVMVSDHGDSFRFEEIKDRIGPVNKKDEQKPIDQLREGGFGLYLIEALMDKVEINNDYGVIVLMTKYIDKAGVELDDQIEAK